MRSFYVNFQCLEKEASFWICETWFNPKTVITSLTVGCDLMLVKKCLYETCLKWNFSQKKKEIRGR